MIIVEITAGLGNQMFQYACGRSLAFLNKTDVVIDASAFATDSKDKDAYSFGLQHYAVSGQVANQEQSRLFQKYNGSGIFAKMYRKLSVGGKYFKKKIIIEPETQYYTFDPELLSYPIKRTVGLKGYWQAEKYFKDIAPVLRKEFSLKGSFSQPALEAMKEVEAAPVPVLVQIRRGDYAKNKEVIKVFGVLELSYFKAGLQKIMDTTKQPITVFFATDDIGWVTEHVSQILPEGVAGHGFISRPGVKSHEELLIMAHCKHFVISNSTFGWWGAWLCPFSEKIVVAPKKWIATPGISAPDIVPEGWLRL